MLFKRSLIALVVLSVSGCSSLPQISTIDMGGVSNGIAQAGKVTVDATRNTWNTTVSFLGFGNKEVDANQLDQYLPGKRRSSGSKDNKEQLPEALVPKIRLSGTLPPADIQTTLNDVAEYTKKPTKDLIRRISLHGSSENSSQNTENMMHEVAAGENLWQIAKRTTGNATNWQMLADINNLQPDGAVFSGQMLLIPSSLKPELTAVIFNQDNANASNEGKAFDVTSGETLWQFTKRTTGDATNWQTIAIHNKFSDEQAATVYPGQTIFVPKSLISADYQVSADTNPSVDTVAVSAAARPKVARAMPEPVVVATMGK